MAAGAPCPEKPLRDELLSIEGLEERALALAASLTIDPNPRRRARDTFPRFEDNVRVLRAAYRTLADDVRPGQFVVSAADWLLDNFHLIAAEISDIRRNLPRTYSRTLPTLAGREHAGHARIYAIAVELIRHSDSRLDRQQLIQFLNSYQRVAPLTIGELWAWPSMLKLALIENLRRLADELLAARAARHAADLTCRGGRPAAVEALPPGHEPAFVVQLLHRVREYGLGLSAIRAPWTTTSTSRHTTAEEAIRREHQRQGVAQVSMANAVTSLRLCATLDWQEYVESVSLVERVLQRDPAGAYGRMDFLSRDAQRQAVEELAAPSGEGQVRVALKAIESARQAAAARVDRRSRRPCRLSPRRPRAPRSRSRPRLSARRRQTRAACLVATHRSLYLGAIAVLTGAPHRRGRRPTRGTRARRTAARARRRAARPAAGERFRHRLRPARGGHARRAEAAAASRFLRGRPRDRPDDGHRPDDADQRGRRRRAARTHRGARAGQSRSVHPFRDPERLRRHQQPTRRGRRDSGARASRHRGAQPKFGAGHADRFFLFHRDRQWNVREHAWIGWERKRGKIEEFNRLLRGATDTSFSTQVGALDVLPSVRYCLTLDSDTRLPRDAAKRLIGIIAHPLNRPHYRSPARACHRRATAFCSRASA